MTSDSYDGHTFYTYDGADQITTENHNTGYPSFIATYDYDHNGNRLHKTQNGQTDTYTYQPNAYNSQTHTDELLSVQGGLTGTKTFGYDTNGVARSITTNGSTLYLTADMEDRYTRFDFDTGPGAGRVNAYETYNGMGLRVFRHDAQGRDFPLAYDGASPGSALLSSAGTSFTPGLAQQDSSGQHFYQTDALGSVRGVSDNAQNPQGEVYYDAFGLPSLRQGQMPGPLGFAGSSGYQTDTDTGLMLLGNRYYDSTIGRFLSPDKVHDGNNWYAYCGNNPLTHTDPTGEYLVLLNGQSLGFIGNMGNLDDANQQFDLNKAQGPVSQSVSDMMKRGQQNLDDANNAAGYLGDFIFGTDNHNRYYGPSSTQAQQIQDSSDYVDMLDQIWSGQSSGVIDTGGAFQNSLHDFVNSTEWQLGAFEWNVTYNRHGDPNGINITNASTFDSFFLHAVSGFNWINDHVPAFMRGAPVSRGISSGPFGTINQTIHLNYP